MNSAMNTMQYPRWRVRYRTRLPLRRAEPQSQIPAPSGTYAVPPRDVRIFQRQRHRHKRVGEDAADGATLLRFEGLSVARS